MRTIVVGIDPGQSGGIAVVDETAAPVQWSPMPDNEMTLARLLGDVVEIATSREARIVVYVERVGPMPTSGAVASFKFGVSFGLIRGVLAAVGVRWELVSPMVWQKPLGCVIAGRKAATDNQIAKKNHNKAIAQRLFPQVPKITHAIADALLIAEYGRRKELGVL